MFVKIDVFVPNNGAVTIYGYELCDENGRALSHPIFDFLQILKSESPLDAELFVAQLKDMAKYGLLGRPEASNNRDALYALPSKYDENSKKITSTYRLYFWIFNTSTVLLGSGCYKPHKNEEGQNVTNYQSVEECEKAADELSKISKFLEQLEKKGELFIEEGLIEPINEIIRI